MAAAHVMGYEAALLSKQVGCQSWSAYAYRLLGRIVNRQLTALKKEKIDLSIIDFDIMRLQYSI
jgi:hypothetical protein